MKLITFLFLSFLLVCSCEEKEVIDATSPSNSQVIQKSTLGNEYADNADLSQPITT